MGDRGVAGFWNNAGAGGRGIKAPGVRTFRVPFQANANSVRARYGKSYRTASDAQKANRDMDMYDGPGRYSRRRRLVRRRRGRPSYKGMGLYTGTGGFWSDLWGKSAGIRQQLGDMARSSGNPWVQTAGHAARAFGVGDYTTSNDLVDGGQGTGVPAFSEGPNIVTISHREYISDIFGPDTAGIFQNQTYGLNPALVQTFPWLAQVASNYEEYTFKQLIFTFRSTVTDFVQSNGQVGTIIMATQYNAADAPFQSKQEVMEYDSAISGKVSGNLISGVECDPSLLSGAPGKYTRSGPVTPQEDVKTFDLGTLNVATSNTPAQFVNQALGELWVTYTVELRKPKFFVSRGLQIQRDVWLGTAAVRTQISALTLASGQQNRIGTNLVLEVPASGAAPALPPGVGILYLVLPATFAGDVCLTLSLSGGGITGAGGHTITVTNPGLAMVPINDMYNSIDGSVPGAATWTNFQESNSMSGGGYNNYTHTSHWTVVTPTSAATQADNVFILNFPVYILENMSIDLATYNTGLNYTTSHEPIMENPLTGLVRAWP